VTATTTNSQNGNIAVLTPILPFLVDGCPSLTQSYGDTIIDLVMVENPAFSVGISTLSVIFSRDITISILLFSVVGRLRDHYL